MSLTRMIEWSIAVFGASLAVTLLFNISGNGVMVVDFMGYCATGGIGLWLFAILFAGQSFEKAFAYIWLLVLPMVGLLGAAVGNGIDLS